MDEAIKETVHAMTDGRTVENRYSKNIFFGFVGLVVGAGVTTFYFKRKEKKEAPVVKPVVETD